jgi:hypothetical protein
MRVFKQANVNLSLSHVEQSAVNLAVLIAHHQVRLHSGHLLGDQAKLWRVYDQPFHTRLRFNKTKVQYRILPNRLFSARDSKHNLRKKLPENNNENESPPPTSTKKMKKHQNTSARAFALRITPHLALLSISALLLGAVPIAGAADVISNGPVNFVTGADAINPRPGTQGGGGQYNSLFYVRPGEGEAPDPNHSSQHQLPNQPFFIAYEPAAGPVQTNDWWTGVGLQWYVDASNSGWAFSWSDGVIRSSGFISEPFYYQFVDFTGASGSQQPPLLPPHGLRLWNQNAIAVKTDGKIKSTDQFNAANNIVDRAFLAPEVQAVVTVGLEGVHPIGTTKPTRGLGRTCGYEITRTGGAYLPTRMAPTRWKSRWPTDRRSHGSSGRRDRQIF